MYTVKKGIPELGATVNAEGVNFGIFSSVAERIVLKIFIAFFHENPLVEIVLTRESHCLGDIFFIHIDNIKEGMAYGFQVINGEGEVSNLLLDPYAYSIKEYPEGSNNYRSIIVDKYIDTSIKPCIPWNQTVLYELHVGAFTKRSMPDSIKGTFKGLVSQIPYLKSLGVTTLELLPIFKWNRNTLKNRDPLTGELLKDRWGYNTIGFFAVDDEYSEDKSLLGEIKAFKNFVKIAHENQLEIILDVVYNHSGEGGVDGDTFHFKGLGKEVYYKFTADGYYLNCSGTGNTLNTNHRVVKKMILDSLRYWVVYMGVDGFRFDLASILGQDDNGRWIHPSLLTDIAEDPILGKVKLIAESWDAKGSYDVGRMPYPFAEWSDYFRDTIRKFVRGDLGLTKALATCIVGSEIYPMDTRKIKEHNIHFVTAHDGFTMWDLVSYNQKNNFRNGENNQDGNNNDNSYNCGVEGATEDPVILANRLQRVKNYFMLLLLSRGVPMLLMGDEMGRTQEGNNNAYCQDNLISWVDWERGKEFVALTEFVSSLIRFRKNCVYFTAEDDYVISWHGVKYEAPDWSYYSKSIAWQMKKENESIYVIANSYVEPLSFELPPTTTGWVRLIDTSLPSENSTEEGILIRDNHYTIQPYSICLLKEIDDKTDAST